MNPKDPKGSFVDGRGVLITGCSSGIGREIAVKLAKHGFTVFATVRQEADAENLRNLNIPNLKPICPVDLTNLGHVTNAAKMVAAELNRGGKEGLSPYVTSIHACDFAINCIARTLDIELKSWRIPNIMIRCGGIKTPAGFRTTADVAAIFQKEPRERVALYEKVLRKWAEDMAEFDQKRTEPEKVAETVLKALSAKRPKRQYSIGHMAKAAGFLEALPQSVADWILKMRF
jgi:NAD(P)-dependent dehydrogenase (short-subunit alcohol dehydrogenase family)